jgi:hypothetical protein
LNGALAFRASLTSRFTGGGCGNFFVICRPLSLGLFRARNILFRGGAHPFGVGRVAHQVGNRETKLRLRAKMRWVKHGRLILV